MSGIHGETVMWNFFSQFWKLGVQDRGLHRLGLSQGLCPWLAGGRLAVPSRSLFSVRERAVCPLLVFQPCWVKAPPLRLCITLITSSKALSPGTVTLALGLQRMNWGGTQFSPYQWATLSRRNVTPLPYSSPIIGSVPAGGFFIPRKSEEATKGTFPAPAPSLGSRVSAQQPSAPSLCLCELQIEDLFGI